MLSELIAQNVSRPGALLRWVEITFLLLLLAGMGSMVYVFNCIDGCGPYHNSTSVADLDGDGDLDVVLSNLRHESEAIFWAGPTLWINQGGGKFTPTRVDFGGPSAAAADVDGDGDVDILQLAGEGVVLYLNQGGVQGGTSGELRIWHTIRPAENLIFPGSHGSLQLGDLNNDGRLDVFVGGCCGVQFRENIGQEEYYPSLSWVWISAPDAKGRPVGSSLSLSALGDLPMRPALGDLDSDGDLDVFAAIQPPKKGGSYLSADRVLLNDGTGSFSDSGQRLAEAVQASGLSGGWYAVIQRLLRPWDWNAAHKSGSTAVALGDLDRDGDLDALVGKPAGAALWINQGGAQGGQAGVFAGSGQRLPGGSSEAVFLADLDGDGDADALLAEKSRAAVWWNNGQAGFSDSGQRLRYTERHGLAVGDFNGDGHLDVFSSAYDIEFHLWLNQGDGRLREEIAD